MRLRWEDCQEFKASLGYVMSSWPRLGYTVKPCLKTNKIKVTTRVQKNPIVARTQMLGLSPSVPKNKK